MLSFRPHKIQVVTFISGGMDENGVMLPDKEETQEMSCRIESNGSAGRVHYEDGIARNYSYTIYLDQDCRDFKVGEKVRLFGMDGKALENDKQFEVIGFFRNQLSARLWV